MPGVIERSVRRQNIHFMHNKTQFSAEYFQFIRKLVMSNTAIFQNMNPHHSSKVCRDLSSSPFYQQRILYALLVTLKCKSYSSNSFCFIRFILSGAIKSERTDFLICSNRV